MSDPFDPGRFSTDPAAAWTLPASYYYDASVYAAEEQRIFLNAWRLVGHVTQLQEPGSFLTENICGNDVFVVRGADGIRAFHNVCRHRAHCLLSERGGKVPGAIRCPYHGWTYSLNGALMVAKHSERIADFDKRDHGLVTIGIEVFCGFVFVNLDPKATALNEQVPGFESTLRRHVPDLDRLVFTSRDEFTVDANWKVLVENSIDWYHVYLSGPAHHAFGKLVDRNDVKALCRPNWVLLRAPVGSPENDAYDFRANAGRGLSAHYLTFYLWPDLLLFTYPHVNAVWSFLMAPQGPEQTREEIAAFTPDGIELDDVTRQAIHWMGKVIGPEDVALNLGVQRGLRSQSYTQGRLFVDPACGEVSEHAIHYFQTRVLETLGRLPPDSSLPLLSDESELDWPATEHRPVT